MHDGRDFFVSYAGADVAWAEWIAWQLEAAGYSVVIQAWDFTGDWVHEMQVATSTSQRVIAVLSPAYLDSAHAEAEWRPFYAADPDGSAGRLIVVRVGVVDPPGLLRTRLYVDLVGRDVARARSALLAAARRVRGKPASEPAIPGAAAGDDAPTFPGGPAPVPASTHLLQAGDAALLSAVVHRLSEQLIRNGFGRDDVDAVRVSLRELVDNVAAHVGTGSLVTVQVDDEPREGYSHHEAFALTVADSGPGFDFEAVLREHEVLLDEDGVEHGLLRAFRLGSLLFQDSLDPHTMVWGRERAPQVPATFDAGLAVPFVLSYREQALRIGSAVVTFLQLDGFLDRTPAFLDLVLDPLLRTDRPYVGIEVVGQGWTGAPSWKRAIDQLLAFRQRHPNPPTGLVAFADTGSSEQAHLRRYCAERGIPLFEDPTTVAGVTPDDVRRRASPAPDPPREPWWRSLRGRPRP